MSSYEGMQLRDKGFEATLETHFDLNIDKVDLFPQDFGRVMLNLFNNAFYSVSEKKKVLNGIFQPKVSVRTESTKDAINIFIKDNGLGIPEKIRDKIFQPFFTTKPSGQGTGLGLSLSYDIITKGYGGGLSVDTQENEFAEFVIRLPVT
jgi:signal transduction histidine kinase